MRWVSSQPGGVPVWVLAPVWPGRGEGGRVQPRWNSQSDDLSSRSAQLFSGALAPPKRGRGPGCTGSHKQTPPYLASLLPGTGPQPTRENSARLLSSSVPDTGGFVHCFPRGARWDCRSPGLYGQLLTWPCLWLRLPRGAGQTGSRLISGR